MKKFLTELMNQIQHFITQFIDWYDWLDEFIFFFSSVFSRETLFDLLLAFCYYSVIKLRSFW